MHFDYTINAGSIISLVGCLLALMTFYYANKRNTLQMHKENIETMQDIKTKMTTVWNWFEDNIINGGNK